MGSQAEDAFVIWLSQARYRELTPKQQAWLYDVAERLGIQAAPAANLVSSGTVKPTKEERASLAAFHESLGPKVTRPPGRRT